MSETQQPRRIGRSILAVILGIIVAAVLSLGSDIVMHVLGYIPSIGERASDVSLAVATIYRTVYGVLGAYVTARLAPRRPMLHVMVLGTLGLLVSIAGAAATWNKGPAFGPHWYPVALVVLALPTAWAGGALRETQLMKGPRQIG
jgi:peptidoglycan/LPS O-acetylase OafA/YrhL